jgi:hypothetical protein
MDRLLCRNDRQRSQVFTVEQRSAAAISAIDRGDSRCTAQLGGSPIVDARGNNYNQTVSRVKRSAGATLQGATPAAVEIAYSVAQRQQMSAAVTEIPARRAGGRFALELADQSFAPHLSRRLVGAACGFSVRRLFLHSAPPHGRIPPQQNP